MDCRKKIKLVRVFGDKRRKIIIHESCNIMGNASRMRIEICKCKRITENAFCDTCMILRLHLHINIAYYRALKACGILLNRELLNKHLTRNGGKHAHEVRWRNMT